MLKIFQVLLDVLTSDPTTPGEGALWYRNPAAGSSTFRGRLDGSTVDLFTSVGLNWTTATRPSPAAGEYPYGFNTDLNAYEYWDGTSWRFMPFPNVLTVSSQGALYTSIKDAVDAATPGQVVQVYPGNYTEDPMIIPSGVSVIGFGNVIITASDNANTLIQLGNGSALFNATINGPTNVGVSTITVPVGNSGRIRRVNILAGADGFDVSGTAQIVESFFGAIDTAITINASSAGTVVDCFFESDTALYVSGASAEGKIIGSKLSNGTNGLYADNGGNIAAASIFIENCDYAMRLGSSVIIDGTVIECVNSGIYDLWQESSSGMARIRASRVDISKINAADMRNIFLTADSDFSGDEAQVLTKELAIGTPEVGREAIFGRGDSTTRNMVVLTTDDTASAVSDGGNFIDVSEEAASDTGSTFTFQGVGVNHTILSCLDLTDPALSDKVKHFGWKIKNTTATSGGVYEFEIWDGAAWVSVGVMLNHATLFYRYADSLFIRPNNFEQVRFGIDSSTTWVSKSINGTTGYWVRVRITTAPAIAPVFEQFKMSVPRMELNENGVLTAHGLTQWRSTLLSVGNVWGDGGLASFNQAVGSGGIPTGWTHLSNNSNLNNNGDTLYTQFILPRGICTAFPLNFRLVYQIFGGGGDPTGDMVSLFSALPLECSGVTVADPSGGISPISRTEANTEITTSKAAPYTSSFTPPATVRTKVQSIELGPLDVQSYYEGDLVLIRWEMDNSGTNNNDIGVWAIEISGVKWTLGEIL